jgi:ribonuclease HI
VRSCAPSLLGVSWDTAAVARHQGSRRRPRRKGAATSDGQRRQIARAARHAATPAAAAAGEWTRVLCDGGSRGNPGPAAVAAVLVAPDGAILDRRASLIGRATAAEAEYRAILLGLQLAAAHGADPLELRSDSLLAIEAVQRRSPADAALAELVREIHAASGRFTAVTWRWHSARENELADALVRALLWR